jgi:hypothetical protein
MRVGPVGGPLNASESCKTLTNSQQLSSSFNQAFSREIFCSMSVQSIDPTDKTSVKVELNFP